MSFSLMYVLYLDVRTTFIIIHMNIAMINVRPEIRDDNIVKIRR